MEMFDQHQLEKYNLDIGSTVYLETWDGFHGILNAARDGNAALLMSSLSKDEILARYG